MQTGGSTTQQVSLAQGPEALGTPSVPIHGLAGCQPSSSEQKHRQGASCLGCGCPVCRRGWVTHPITMEAVQGWGQGWAGDCERPRGGLPSSSGAPPRCRQLRSSHGLSRAAAPPPDASDPVLPGPRGQCLRNHPWTPLLPWLPGQPQAGRPAPHRPSPPKEAGDPYPHSREAGPGHQASARPRHRASLHSVTASENQRAAPDGL